MKKAKRGTRKRANKPNANKSNANKPNANKSKTIIDSSTANRYHLFRFLASRSSIVVNGKYIPLVDTYNIQLYKKRGGGDFLDGKCSITPLTPDDPIFSHLNDPNISDVFRRQNITLDRLNIDIEKRLGKGSYNEVFRSTCKNKSIFKFFSKTPKTPKNQDFLYRTSVTSSGPEHEQLVYTSSPNTDSYTYRYLNNNLYENYFQIVLANAPEGQLAPDIYMFGTLTKTDNPKKFEVFSISELMTPIEDKLFFTDKTPTTDARPTIIGPFLLTSMFELIDNVGNHFTFVDIKPPNMVHQAVKVGSRHQLKTYMIDTDPTFLIQDSTLEFMIDRMKKKYKDIRTICEHDREPDIATIRRGIMYYVFCHYMIAWYRPKNATKGTFYTIDMCLDKLGEYFDERVDPLKSIFMNRLISELITPPFGHEWFYKIYDAYIFRVRVMLTSSRADEYFLTENQPDINEYSELGIRISPDNLQRKRSYLNYKMCLVCNSASFYGIRCDAFPLYCKTHADERIRNGIPLVSINDFVYKPATKLATRDEVDIESQLHSPDGIIYDKKVEEPDYATKMVSKTREGPTKPSSPSSRFADMV